MKCARTACNAEAHPLLRNKANGQLYCPRCARLINASCGGDAFDWPTPAQIGQYIAEERLVRAFDSELVVERHSTGEDGRVRVHYRSVLDPNVEWTHQPFDQTNIPPVGTIGRIGFVPKRA